MEKTKDWAATKRREAQWKLFYPAEIFLKGQFILAALGMLLLAYLVWSMYTGEITLKGGSLLIFLQLLAAATFFGYPSYIIKRDKLPSVAVGRHFLALKRIFFPGYLLLRWEEIDTVTQAVKNPYMISLQLKGCKPHTKLDCYFTMKRADVNEIILLAQKHLPPSSSPSMFPLSEEKRRMRPFFRKLLYIFCAIITLLIVLIIYAVVDTNKKMPTHAELQENGSIAIYTGFAGRYPDSVMDTDQAILNYALMYNGWLIEKHCKKLTDFKTQKLRGQMATSERLLTAYMSSALNISLYDAEQRVKILHNMILEKLTLYQCDDRAEKMIEYTRNNARKWENDNAVQPYHARR